MSLSYIEHQRSRFWKNHEQIYDYRKYEDMNWLGHVVSPEQRERERNRRGNLRSRRDRFDDERREREDQDSLFRKKKEMERKQRIAERSQQKNRDLRREDNYRQQKIWSRHIEQRRKYRKAASNRSNERRSMLDKKWNETMSRRNESLARREYI
eukprot:TRINITY_DN2000_c0_g1_i1.p1 TRINITY_DN2000_c0_g1~~TRINITY_DN2000_c0_g1_i1.p1  ORF type:complete len:154 (-),score=33.03 TRINITY_DN2000_c0_g1_i1:81-542(-)